MALNRNSARSQQNLSVGEGMLHNFDVESFREKKNGSSPNLTATGVALDLPTEPKRRRVMGDDASACSTVSSQVSSRCHSPTLSEFDDSFLSTPGNSPSATLKEKFRRKYGRNELLSAIDQYLMDSEIIDVCKSQDEDDGDSLDNTKVSLAEFRKQYQELAEWLNQVFKVTQKTQATLTSSEKYLAQSYHEDLLQQSAPRQKSLLDYARQLLQRYPHLKQEIDDRVHHISNQWERVERAVSCKGMWQNVDTMYKDMATDLKNLNTWLEDIHRRLLTMALKPPTNNVEKEKCLAEHQVLQKDIESHSRNINAILKLCTRLHDEFDGYRDHGFPDLEHAANKLHTRWQEVWLQSIEWQCKLENALTSSKNTSTPNAYLTNWIPRHFASTEYDHFEADEGRDDSLTSLLPRQADLAESPPYDCSLSTSGDNSGKDSAVVSEVEVKMSSECSDSDLDMLRKTRLRSENRDIGYSSGTSASPITAGQTSTESDCDNIRKLIERVDRLVDDVSPKAKSPSRQRKSESPSKQRASVSSCDASSEESELSGEEFSTASDNPDALYDSVLGLDYNSDEPVPSHNLPRFCNTAKLRQGQRKKKDRPWSAIQTSPLDDVDLMDLSKSDTAIDKIKDASDSSDTPRRRLNKGSSTLPRAGAKRKLYESSAVDDTLLDSDAESSMSEDYETARSDASMSEPEDHMTSTASFSEPTWDNYHQVYMSLGEEDEQPLTWTPLEEDLEFDEEVPGTRSSLLQQVLDRRKVKTKPRLGSRHGYDSDSDMEDLIYLIDESASQLKIADHHLKKKSKDYLGTGVDINTHRYAEIIATCETNIKCLQNVLQHLNAEVTEEEIEKIKDILYQWEKLYAFATEKQNQSQQLSVMSKLLEEIQTEVGSCDAGSMKLSYPNIRELEACLISSKTKLEGLSILECKTEELQTKTGAFQMEHPAVNLLLFTKLLSDAEANLRKNREILSKKIPNMQHTFDLWEKYNETKEDMENIMSQEFQPEFSALRQVAGNIGLESERNLQHLNTILSRYEEKTRHLQSLRSELMELVDDSARVELTNEVADAHDRLTDAQRQYRTLMWSVDQEIEREMEQVEESMELAATHPAKSSPVSSSSSLSSSSSWYSSRYIKAAGAFMIFGIASYFVDPDALKRIGDLTVTFTPELRYVNGPPPI